MANIIEGTLAASAARTTTQTLDPIALGTQSGIGLVTPMGTPRVVEVVIDTTAFGTGSVTPSIEGYDEAKGAFVAYLTGAAIVATGTVVLRLGQGIANVANLAQQGLVPKRWRVICTANNANSQTYSVSARVLAD